jgi:hypothetical protein
MLALTHCREAATLIWQTHLCSTNTPHPFFRTSREVQFLVFMKEPLVNFCSVLFLTEKGLQSAAKIRELKEHMEMLHRYVVTPAKIYPSSKTF